MKALQFLLLINYSIYLLYDFIQISLLTSKEIYTFRSKIWGIDWYKDT